MSLELPKGLVEAMIAHAREEYPNECCGLLAGRGVRVERLYRGRNVHQSPYIYEIDPSQLLHFFRDMDASGLDLVGIYHSHTQSAAYPSSTDVRRACYPAAAYVIVGLRNASPEYAAEVRAFRIRDGQIVEEDWVAV